MQQLTCIDANTLEWRDVPAPHIQGDGEALVRPLAVALDARSNQILGFAMLGAEAGEVAAGARWR